MDEVNFKTLANKVETVETVPTIGDRQYGNRNKMSREQTLMALCYALNCEPADLQHICQSRQRMSELERKCAALEHALTNQQSCGGNCREVAKKCDGLWKYCIDHLCPANVPFSRVTIDEYSGINQIELNTVIKVEDDNSFVDNFPVAPGQKIKLTHAEQPGFIPKELRVDIDLANGGTNYLDIHLEFFLVGGPTPKKLGVTFRANEFLNKDGSQIAVPWPHYKGCPVEVGFSETVVCILSHRGLANNVESAMIRLKHDLEQWYAMCSDYGFGHCLPNKC